MTTTLTAMPYVKRTFFDTTSGVAVVAAGYKLFTYAAGSSTKVNTYTDALAGGTNTNPIILDTAGQADIFLVASSYKFILAPPTDTDPPTSPIWSEDNIISVPTAAANVDVTGTFGVSVTADQVVYLSDGTGGKNAGQWYLGDATNNYSSSTAPFVGFALATTTAGTLGTIRMGGNLTGLAGLAAGSIYYISGTPGSITATAPANRRTVLVADSSTSGVVGSGPISKMTDVQSFTGSGVWTKPDGALIVGVLAFGAGGGGGGGAGVAGAGAVSTGGGGGGGGARVYKVFRASDLSATVTVTIGTAGTHGTGGTAADGTSGGIGGDTTFGAYVKAWGGGGGSKGTNAAGTVGGGGGGGASSDGTSGAPVAVGVGGEPGGSITLGANSANTADCGAGGGLATGFGAVNGGGGGAGCGNVGAAGNAGGISQYGGGGGGSGGGVSAGNATSAGGAGAATGATLALTATGGGGTGGLAGAAFNANQNGTAGSSTAGGFGGGGGGSRRDGTAAAAGGSGGQPGGGGGGGGAGQNATSGGNGGDGGAGAVYVFTDLGAIAP